MKLTGRRSFVLVLSILVVFVGAIAVAGQTVSGTLRGTVTDANGAVVPNATVMVRNKETGLERTACSGAIRFSWTA